MSNVTKYSKYSSGLVFYQDKIHEYINIIESTEKYLVSIRTLIDSSKLQMLTSLKQDCNKYIAIYNNIINKLYTLPQFKDAPPKSKMLLPLYYKYSYISLNILSISLGNSSILHFQ